MKNVYAWAVGGVLAVAGLSSAQDWGPWIHNPTKSASCAPSAPCATPAAAAEDCGPCIWGGVDYLLWWVTDSPLPTPLITRGGSGVLGGNGTQVIYGGRPVDYDTFSGIRLWLGGWIDKERKFGVEGSGFFLFQDTKSFTAQSNALGSPTLGQPTIVPVPGLGEQAYLTSSPGLFYGTLHSELTFRFYGWDVNGVANVIREEGLEVDALLGYRNLRLSEQLLIRSNVRTIVGDALQFLGTPLAANSVLITGDSFGASTDVYAPQVGAHARFTADRFSTDLTAKVAMGVASEHVAIAGTTTFLPPFPQVGSRSALGGILATSTNIPGGSTTRFVVVPELTGRVGYALTDMLTLSVGYSALYISDVVRPGNQIDRVVNPNNVPSDQAFGRFAGPNRPALEIRHTDFWAHGVNFGAEIRY